MGVQAVAKMSELGGAVTCEKANTTTKCKRLSLRKRGNLEHLLYYKGATKKKPREREGQGRVVKELVSPLKTFSTQPCLGIWI